MSDHELTDLLAPALAANPEGMSTTPTTRYEIVQKGDGRIYVRTSTPLHNGMWVGCMMHSGYFTTREQAEVEIARQKAKYEEERKAAEETVLHTEVCP